MSWRHGRWQVEHALPVGVSERAHAGDRVRAGDIIGSGTVVGSVVAVPGARHLGVHATDLDAVTRIRVGAEVDKGAVLARSGRRFARAAVAPLEGRVVHRTAEGDFLVAPVVDRWTVRSTMDGEVVRSDDAAVVVRGTAWSLAGIAAYGPDAIGELALGVDAPGDALAPSRIDVRLRDRIVVGGSRIAAEAITRAHACGVSGLVAGAAPAGGLRVVYGDDVTAAGLPSREDRPTLLCLVGFGAAALPREIFLPLVDLAGSRASIHTATARLFVFTEPDAARIPAAMPALVLAGDFGGVRPLEGETELLPEDVRFPSELESAALMTRDGAVPLPNVLPFDAPR